MSFFRIHRMSSPHLLTVVLIFGMTVSLATEKWVSGAFEADVIFCIYSNRLAYCNPAEIIY